MNSTCVRSRFRNPGRSFMWQTTSFQRLFSTIECQSTQMHHCMYGSSRRKLTRLIHNIQSFHQLHQTCNNKHEHEPWGQKPDGSWATSEETAYPWHLARAIAAPVLSNCKRRGSFATFPASQNKNVPYRPCVLLQIFNHAKTCRHIQASIHQDAQAPLPAHARLLSTPKRGYVASAKESNDNQARSTK